MSQHDFNIANQSFPATRTDLNNALQALASNSSGDAEPSTTFANQWWYETDTNTLKLRNEANNAWLSFATVDQSTGDWTLAHDVDITGTLTSDGLTVAGATSLTGNLTVDGGTIKLDGNYPVGTGNVALGDAALDSNVSGGSNVAIGADTLTANTASNNTAVGYQALYANTTGASNVAVGQGALDANTTASNNNAFGVGALTANTTGSANNAFGLSALGATTTSNHNSGFGSSALQANTTGERNSSFGSNALAANTTASGNTAFGYFSLAANTTGASNTAFGDSALQSVTTGSGNVAIGQASGGQGSMINITTEDNRAVFGHTSITNAYVKVAFTVTSDARDKTNINPIPHGLDFVQQLNPVSYNFKKSREDDTPHGNKRYGFLAQDILALEGDDNVIIDNEQVDHLKYQGESLVPVLVKAIQELSAKNDALEARLAALES